MSGIELALAGTLLIVALLLLVVMIQLYNQMSRYERFRGETATVIANVLDNLSDMNARLTAAGFPPHQVRPASTSTGWVHQMGQFGSGSDPGDGQTNRR